MAYVLFYSNYCKFSEKYIKILERSGEANFFSKICVDKNESNMRHPFVAKYSIKEVPTIIVENKRLAGREAFKWLKNRIETRQDSRVNSVQSRDNKPEINQALINSGNILPYYEGTEGMFSKNCLSIGNNELSDNKIITPDSDEGLERGSLILKDDMLIPPEESNFTEDSLKSKQLDNEYNKLLKERGL